VANSDHSESGEVLFRSNSNRWAFGDTDNDGHSSEPKTPIDVNVRIEIMQQVTINTSYYCERPKSDGPVHIFVTGAYRVGEYDQQNDDFRWHRVVPAPQKVEIEKWFSLRFRQMLSVQVAPEPEPPTPTKKLTRHARA
jgi:hypothetical protein